FQAEDGIRDSSVTGVQTCALPISIIANKKAGRASGSFEKKTKISYSTFVPQSLQNLAPGGNSFWQFEHFAGTCDAPQSLQNFARSEERRVGKEDRCRVSPMPDKEK